MNPALANTIQVAPDHYRPANYDELHRWISYWYQIQSIARSGARRVLEIGVGSGILSNYLRQRLGLEVSTCDFDAALEPNIVADVRHLDRAINQASYDAVVAFQVLEHLPFEDFPKALRQLARASSDWVILSLPYYGYAVQFRMKLWKWTCAFGRKISKNPTWSFNGEHHWELGTRGHSLATVRGLITKELTVQREYFCVDYPYHYFFECRLPKTP